ncbi:MAG: hypothetical protein WCF04_15255 [Candidatus Nanopelagicales bacterium]
MTREQVAAFDAAILGLIYAAEPPVTARQTFYMAVGSGLTAKDDNGYRRIIRRLSAMRESGALPWSWIADNTRWVREATTYGSLWDALAEWQATYRRNYWASQPERLELWVESDSIASFLGRIVDRHGVPLFVCKGQASKSYVHGAAETAERLGKPVHVLYLGDWDPTGVRIDQSVAERYRRYGTAQLDIERIGIVPEQITAMSLLGTPAKRTDPNYRHFEELCRSHGLPVLAVETEAMPPDALRELVDQSIAVRIDQRAWQAVAGYEASEREQLAHFLEDGGANPECGIPW